MIKVAKGVFAVQCTTRLIRTRKKKKEKKNLQHVCTYNKSLQLGKLLELEPELRNSDKLLDFCREEWGEVN